MSVFVLSNLNDLGNSRVIDELLSRLQQNEDVEFS